MARIDNAWLEAMLARGSQDIGQATRGVLVVRGTPIPLRTQDIFDAARMLVGEGAWECELHAAVVLWTVAQRQAYMRKTDMSFSTFVRAFSQPLNPIWARGGARCRPPVDESDAPYCTESHFQRRERMDALTWATIPESAKRFAMKWAVGAMRNPVPGVIDFAAWPVGSTKPGYKPVARFGNNTFYVIDGLERGNTARWDGSQVFIADANGTRVSEAGIERTLWDAILAPVRLTLRGASRSTEYNLAQLSQGCDVLT